MKKMIQSLILLLILSSCFEAQKTVQQATTELTQSSSSQTIYELQSITIIDQHSTNETDGVEIYTCYYDRVIDGSVALTTACTSLSGVSFDADKGILYWVPSISTVYDPFHLGLSESYEFRIGHDDGNQEDVHYYPVNVLNLNLPPDLIGATAQDVNEGIAITSVDINDSNSTDFQKDGDQNIYTCVHVEDDSSETDCTDISIGASITSLGIFNWTPDFTHGDDNPTHQFKICAYDLALASDCISLYVTVFDVNQSITLDLDSDYGTGSVSIIIDEKQTLATLDINEATTGTDLDSDGDQLVYKCYYDTTIDLSVDENSALECQSLGIVFSGINATFNWTPSKSQANTYEFKVVADDQHTHTSSLIFDITVLEVPLMGIRTIYAGGDHNCFINEEGKVYCWGDNSNGEFGNATTNDQDAPYKKPSTIIGAMTFKTLALGADHSCGIDSSNILYCWGDNKDGKLGNDSTTDSLTPVKVNTDNLSNESFTQISSLSNHTCGLTSRGRVFCWGNNNRGQVGNGTNVSIDIPTRVDFSALTSYPIRKVVVGNTHSCAIDVQGKLYCWGENTNNQITSAVIASSYTPLLTDSGPFIDIALGDQFTCTLKATGISYCIGDDTNGAMGDDLVNANLTTISNVVSDGALTQYGSKIIAGLDHACLLKQTGDVVCWGDNTDGQLGDGNSPTAALVTVTISPPVDEYYIDIVAGNAHTCAQTNKGNVLCWGDNTSGQIGNESATTSFDTAQTISTTHFSAPTYFTFKEIAAGGDHTCGLNSYGLIWCFGEEDNLAAFNISDNTKPNLLDTISLGTRPYFSKIYAGENHSCAIAANNELYCWGLNPNGELGDGTTTDATAIPVQADLSSIALNGAIKDVALGDHHSCILYEDGITYCWGKNDLGQLGDGLGIDSVVPVLVSQGGELYIDIDAGANHTCALTDKGTIYCWGANSAGQLGDNSNTDALAPTQVYTTNVSEKYAIKIAIGQAHSCALFAHGRTYCWGENSSGELGNASYTDSSIPRKVDITSTDIESVTDIILGNGVSCLLDQDSNVYCWGSNTYGALGTGSTVKSNIPKALYAVNFTTYKIMKLSAFRNHVCALTSAGRNYCWGSNTADETTASINGKIGSNGIYFSTVPRIINDP